MKSGPRDLRASDQPGERTRVMIEPADQQAAQAVRERLKEIGATGIREITEGFISAEIPADEIERMQELARTGALPRKQMR
jgi:hypothetical protein